MSTPTPAQVAFVRRLVASHPYPENASSIARGLLTATERAFADYDLWARSKKNFDFIKVETRLYALVSAYSELPGWPT